MRNQRIFLYIVAIMIFLTACKENKVGPDPKEPELPAKLTILEPSAVSTYWSDQEVACLHDAPKYNAQTEWKANGEAVACNDGQLSTELPAGTHSITATISEESESVTATVDITIKAAFSVTLDNPQSGEEFFVGDEVTCAATITPEEYQDHPITITVGGNDCTSSPARLAEAGEVDVRASAEIDGRTEADEATVRALPVVAGKVYPLTDEGVSGQAGGFSITLTADGETLTTTSAANGDFRFSAASPDVYSADEIALEVKATGEFYGSRAEFRTYTPWTPDDDGLPIIAGSELLTLVGADELGFILAPKHWQIRCGPFAGESTGVKLPEAFKRYDPDGLFSSFSSFYMLYKVVGKLMYRGLLPEDRPLPVAFNRAESEVAITAADSTVFWAETENVEAKICRGDLFAPATIDEVPAIQDGVWVTALSKGGLPTGGAAGKNGHIKGGVVDLPIADFGNSDTQAHELNQVLGFGETSEWVGIMTSGKGSTTGDVTKYSTDDIAHIQLYMDTVDLQSNEGVSFGVLEWMQAFDIPSLPETSSTKYPGWTPE